MEQLEVIPKNMAWRRLFKTTWFQLAFHTVLGNLALMASHGLNVTLFAGEFNRENNNNNKERRQNDGQKSSGVLLARRHGYCMEVLTAWWKLYGPTWGEKEGHLHPVSEPQKFWWARLMES